MNNYVEMYSYIFRILVELRSIWLYLSILLYQFLNKYWNFGLKMANIYILLLIFLVKSPNINKHGLFYNKITVFIFENVLKLNDSFLVKTSDLHWTQVTTEDTQISTIWVSLYRPVYTHLYNSTLGLELIITEEMLL